MQPETFPISQFTPPSLSSPSWNVPAPAICFPSVSPHLAIRSSSSNIDAVSPLSVAVPPKNVILQKPPPAKSDSTLTLACTAEDSNPKTQLLWYRGGNLIHNAGNFGERHGMTTLGSCDQYFMPRISSHFRREFTLLRNSFFFSL